MLSSFRRLSQSKAGAAIMVAFLVAILASFALADINQFRSTGFGGGYLAKAGKEQVTETDFNAVADRALQAERQRNPEATMASIAKLLPDIIDQLIDERAMKAFGDENGLILSKRLVDAQIAELPQGRGLDGKFNENAFRSFLARERLSESMLRDALASELRGRLMLTPVGGGASLPTGVATHYASMLLEQRTGSVVLLATDAFTAGLNPSAGDLTSFYNANKARYMVPEQRVLQFVRVGPEQVAKVEPTDADIAAYYKANAAKFAATPQRVISQATVPTQQAAAAIAARAKAGGSIAAAAAPAGIAAADTTLGLQTLTQYRDLVGEAAARQVFGAAKGAIVGPVQSSFGWTVAKVEDIRDQKGKTVAEARDEIRAALLETKRKDALADLVGKVEDSIAEGASLAEAAKANGLTMVETAPILPTGTSLTDKAYKLPPQFAPALKSGFGLAADEDPIVASDTQTADNTGYTVVGVGRIVASAPAPLDGIRDRVRADWIQKQANSRAQAIAQQIATAVGKGMSIEQAVASLGQGKAKVQPVTARRIQLSQAAPEAVAPLRMLFSLSAGKSRLAADPKGRGFFVVKTDKIVPGNAATQPGLIVETQRSFSQSLGEELAQQFIAAARDDVGVKRKEEAIKAAIARQTGAAGQ